MTPCAIPLARRAAALARAAVLGLATVLAAPHAAATTPLADQPLFTNSAVPGNLALVLSVEFPTAVSVAHLDSTYSPTREYMGLFDPKKCYLYRHDAVEANRHFFPAGAATNLNCTAAGDELKWSGNFLNWATTQTIDPFRWVLTGGYRVVDTVDTTIIEKAWASGQGGTGNFPNRTETNAASVAGATPFGWTRFRMRIQGLGNRMRFTQDGDVNNASTPWNPAAATVAGTVYEVSVRVKVCDASAGAGGVESNCVRYPSGHFKPEGLLQQYSDRMRYSTFGYLNDGNLLRDGGVLRARQKFIAPLRPVPGSAPVANPANEWDPQTGVLHLNPDAADASDTAALFGVPIGNSGVMNYLNKFGQINTANGYKTFDPISELYYAAIRYFKRQGNVSAWTDMSSADNATRTRWIDGFPVITNWDDPILYSCQRNFILGIGDVNTHADKNLPGATNNNNEPARPPEVSADTTVNAVTATNKVGELQGISSLGTTYPYGGCCNRNSALLAGLAYDANTVDIRPDVSSQANTIGKQTVQTFWLDVLEYQTYKTNNQFYLAAKFGGFNVPEGFQPYTRTEALPTEWWSTTTETVGGGAQRRPDNYYTADRPDQIISGLTKAFADIASKLTAFTTSFSTALPQLTQVGNASFSAKFDADKWTGDIVANKLSFGEGDAPIQAKEWSFAERMASQGAGTGWNTGRLIATFDNTAARGVPFRHASLPAAQRSLLDTAYRTGDDSADYVNYLRGDRTHEQGSTASGSAKAYRTRDGLVGDIVGSKVRAVGAPAAPFSEAANPGYAKFKSDHKDRPLMLYVGTNAGVLHAIRGSIKAGEGGGQEVFAYVPGALYQGPTGTPAVNGLAALGNPVFEHKYYVNATASAFDVNLGRTPGGSGTDWRTMLVGGLGKGGRSYYAIDVTDPNTMTSESVVAGRVMWEFTDSRLGYTFGEPLMVKTRKYGWTLVMPSGYNNADGRGYFLFVNPRNGQLLEAVGTGAGSATQQAGLAHVQAFMLDRTDGLADALYAGDLLGNVWRLDISAAAGSYPDPVQLAVLTDGAGNALPVTTRPIVEVQPITNRRYVLVGTGRLLADSDIASGSPNAFFAIMDGTSARPRRSGDAPAGVGFPATRSDMVANTNLLEGVTLDLDEDIGWFIDLNDSGTGPGWRVITDPTSFLGVVMFSAMQPGGDACSPSGKSRLYAVGLGDGKSRLKESVKDEKDGTMRDVPVSYLDDFKGVITDMRVTSVEDKATPLVGDDNGSVVKPNIDFGLGTGRRRLNWRELPVAD